MSPCTNKRESLELSYYSCIWCNIFFLSSSLQIISNVLILGIIIIQIFKSTFLSNIFMKSNQRERVIKKGNYYELQTIQDLIMQQKIPKKQEVSTIVTANNQSILTTLPSRSEAYNNYILASTASVNTEDYGLNEYQSSLELLLNSSIKDEQRLQIQKILKQISSIRSNKELPLNKLPQFTKAELKIQSPARINLISHINLQNLNQNLDKLQAIKYTDLCKIQNVVQILLNDRVQQLNTQQISQIDPKVKEQVESVYNAASQLKSLQNLMGMISKIDSNEEKYLQINNWQQNIEKANTNNRQILDELQNDQLMLNQLEISFKKNIQSVRAIVKKISDLQ